jgi:hypothetical protein
MREEMRLGREGEGKGEEGRGKKDRATKLGV